MGKVSGWDADKHLTPIFLWIFTVDTASMFRYTESVRDIGREHFV